ncbi:hypothetical protein HBB16_06385 [Pseudonocardia sp. MCCB 268]|nr:hypothetical protein [Pseudonocardia cytotoxica]
MSRGGRRTPRTSPRRPESRTPHTAATGTVCTATCRSWPDLDTGRDVAPPSALATATAAVESADSVLAPPPRCSPTPP